MRRVTSEEIREMYPRVARIIASALDRDIEEVALDAGLIDDLQAESIDLLDILFRLEREFKVKLPQGRIIDDARGDIPEAEFEHKGVVTEAGLQRLREYLDEVPAERWHASMKLADIPRLFTVATFCKLVARARRATAAS
jgi:acyl carrier protein